MKNPIETLVANEKPQIQANLIINYNENLQSFQKKRLFRLKNISFIENKGAKRRENSTKSAKTAPMAILRTVSSSSSVIDIFTRKPLLLSLIVRLGDIEQTTTGFSFNYKFLSPFFFSLGGCGVSVDCGGVSRGLCFDHFMSYGHSTCRFLGALKERFMMSYDHKLNIDTLLILISYLNLL